MYDAFNTIASNPQRGLCHGEGQTTSAETQLLHGITGINNEVLAILNIAAVEISSQCADSFARLIKL
jgi:hypothetical protein